MEMLSGKVNTWQGAAMLSSLHRTPSTSDNYFRYFLWNSTTTTALQPFAWDYLGEPVTEETFNHLDLSWSLIILFQLPPFTTIHRILPVQFTCLTVFLHNLSPSPLWSTSWSGTLHFIIHKLLYPIILFFSQHMPIPLKPKLCHLILVSLSTHYLELYLNVTYPSDRSHLWLLNCYLIFFSYRPESLPCNILLHT